MQLLTPDYFSNYELIDCGDFEKLERFGKFITIRPEPQAVWAKQMNEREWLKLAHLKFIPKSSSSGEWKKLQNAQDKWDISYTFSSNQKHQLNFKLSLTSFKHVGLFPEQAVNWEKIYQFFQAKKGGKFLNLFAYTGGASLAAKAAGAHVTHVDSIKQVVSWANENMQLSKLNDIRWVVDDALKFVKKEIRRGNFYEGIILDPPSYGHGPNGEKWKLEENIQEMIEGVLQILNPDSHLLILNAYSLGFSALVPENLLRSFALKNKSQLHVGELYLKAKTSIKLPLGVWGSLNK
ncbi:MAG: class I SAM-dependent methyltransferase [Bacteroidetes bacterium]|nr:class I SAM-dependent methyltransferase [Bacteroidota bacterium]